MDRKKSEAKTEEFWQNCKIKEFQILRQTHWAQLSRSMLEKAKLKKIVWIKDLLFQEGIIMIAVTLYVHTLCEIIRAYLDFETKNFRLGMFVL